ncbi:MAG: CBS domain-containing protein [Gammaproteobacteria bacterium]|nr:CBS domain-containing protein [Gammaproteobacteria bacterium]MDH5802688.1 CBS domain-containing protein [Gammaproteobacteria bacterium]
MSEIVYQFAFSFLKQEAKAAARLLEELEPKDTARFLSNAPLSQVVAVLKEMQPSACAEILLATDLSTAVIWLSEMANNQLCAILRHMEKSRLDEILSQLHVKRRTACQLLLSYSNEMVGAWIEIHVPVFPGDMSVEDAIKRLKRKNYKEDRIILVVDDQHRPTGSLSVTELLRSPQTATVESISEKNVGVILGRMALTTAINHTLWMEHDIAAVVNRRREFIGVIWYSRIRRILSVQTQVREPAGGMALDFFQAYGESMQGLFEAVRESID